MQPIFEQGRNLQVETLLKREKRAIETFEEATEKGKYDYWLTQADIADIARIKYNYFRSPFGIPDLFEFEISGSITHLTTQIKKFQSSTQLTENRLTLIINIRNQHWVTLVISRRYSAYDGFYIDSQAGLLPDEYYELLRRFKIIVNDFSLHFSQQTDNYNCGLWALENAADVNKMLDEAKPFDWLISQLKRPRNYYYFNTVRRSLVQTLHSDAERRARLYPNTLQGENIVPEEDNSLHALGQAGPAPKRVKLQGVNKDVEIRLEKFVESFMGYFSQRLAAFEVIARGKMLTIPALKQELKTGATGALFGSAIAQSVSGAVPSLVASLRTVSHRYYISEKKAQKITRNFSSMPSGDLSNILAEAAVEIFKSYEAQFMHITDRAGDKIAMEKLAEDAVGRVINFFSKKDILLISIENITKGVIFGSSNRYFDPNLKRFRFSILGNVIEGAYENKIYTADLFEKVGLFISTADSSLFYKKAQLAEVEQYGYRHVFNWEKTAVNTLAGSYEQNYEQITHPQMEIELQRDLQAYQYSLGSIGTQRKAQSILAKIKTRFQDAATLVKPDTKKSILFNLRAPVENFIGRTAALRELHQTLLSGRTSTIVSAISAISLSSGSNPELTSGSQASISGLGGIGKTQLALRYAQLNRAAYGNNVLWINSDTKADISCSFLKLATKLDIKTKDRYGEDKDIETIVEAIYEYFSDQKSLFVFDNVENYEEIESFLPKSMIGNKPSLLITSRYKNWNNVATVISLDVFTEQESLELVKQGLSISDDSQNSKINELTHLLQGLPLALQQAIAYIHNQKKMYSQYSIENYLGTFKEKSRSVLDFNFKFYNNDPYLKTVYTTWQITLDVIRREGEVGQHAIEILNMMSFMFPENISIENFSVSYERDLLNAAMHLLRVYSMTSAGSISSECVVHRLVQKVVNLYLESDTSEFLKIALKVESLVMYYARNIETRFHYVNFLLNIVEHPELKEYLSFKCSFKRISNILMIDDLKMWKYFYDIAYTKLNKENYILFLTESFLNYRKQADTFYMLTILDYFEKKLAERKLTKEDIRNILHNDKLSLKPEYRINYISTIPEKRERQLFVVSLIGSFREKLFSEERSSICPLERKKRSAGISCLQKKQAQKEAKKQKTIKHLENVSHISRFVSTGLFAKDTIAALLRGDFSNVAINFSLLLSGRFFGSLSNALLAQGEKLIPEESALLQKDFILENKSALDIFLHQEVILSGKKKILIHTVKMAAPFIARGTSIFFAYNLIKDIQQYKSGDTRVLSSLVSNGVIVGIDGVEASIEVAELLEIITGVSEFTGPIGEGAVVLMWLGTEGYETNKGLDAIEKCVDLTLSDKFIQGLRLFFGLGPSEYMELKAKNNQLLQHALAFLKEHSEVKRYVFSASSTEADSLTRSEVHLDNKFNLTLSESMPDVPSDTQLFCVSGTRITTRPVFHLGAQPEARYFCKKTIGIEYSVNRTGDATLIALDKGDDKAIVVSQTPTIFLVNEGDKAYRGNDKGNLFFMLGNHVTGTLEGGNGIDLVLLNNFYADTNASALIDRQQFLCGRSLAPYAIMPQCASQNKVALININQIYGRLNKKDVLYLTKNITLVDGKGGESEASPDIVYVTGQSEQGLKIILRANTQVNYIDSNSAPYPVDHVIPNTRQGKAQVGFPFRDNLQLRFYFDYYFENLTALTIDNHRLQFNLSSAQSVDFQNETLSLTLQNTVNRFQSNSTTLPESTYYFFKDGIQIKVLDENHIYAKADSISKLDKLIDSFIVAANRLQKTFTIQLSHNQTVSIGQEKNEILLTNCLAESYLIGNGGENLYVISPLNTTSFPLPEVTLYDVSEDEMEGLRDTLDLREVMKKVNSTCPGQTPSISLHEEGNDLIMVLTASHYLLNQECVQSATRWTVISVRFKEAMSTEWFQKMDVLLEDDKPRTIQYNTAKGWYLSGESITFDDDKEIIVITNKDISQNAELVLLKNVGNFTFLNRNGTDLIITNTLDEDTYQYDLYTIICSQFYELDEMREKVLSLTFLFLDQELSLKNYEEQINTTISFSNTLNDLLSDRPVSPLPSAANITNGVVTLDRDKRQVNPRVEKPVSSSATKIFSPFYELFNWAKKQGSLLIASVNNYILPGTENESKLPNQKINYQKKMTKKIYSKWNKFYKQEGFFTQMHDCPEAKNIPLVREDANFLKKCNGYSFLKHQTKYRKEIFPKSNVPLYQDFHFRSERFLSRVTPNVDVNETLVFANYLLRAMGRN